MAFSLDQFLGSILGLAVGDALGAAWEGLSSEMIFEMGPADAIVAHASKKTIYYTDDTQMMIGVLQVLIDYRWVHRQGFVGESFCGKPIIIQIGGMGRGLGESSMRLEAEKTGSLWRPAYLMERAHLGTGLRCV